MRTVIETESTGLLIFVTTRGAIWTGCAALSYPEITSQYIRFYERTSHTELSIISTPGEDFVSSPACRGGFASGDANNRMTTNRTRNLSWGRLNGLFCTASGHGLNDVTELRETVEAPTMDFTILREDESVVLADSDRLDGKVEARKGDRIVLSVLARSQTTCSR